VGEAAARPACALVRRHAHDRRGSGRLHGRDRALVVPVRDREGGEASPSAGIIDGPSVETTESGGIRGHDAGKAAKGRKRHIVTDRPGPTVGLVVHGAGVQDRDGAPTVPASIPEGLARLRHGFADGGRAGPKPEGAPERIGQRTAQIVTRSGAAQGFGSCHAGGSSSGHAPGSADIADWRGIAKGPSPAPRRGSEPPRSAAPPDGAQGIDMPRGVSGRALGRTQPFGNSSSTLSPIIFAIDHAVFSPQHGPAIRHTEDRTLLATSVSCLSAMPDSTLIVPQA